MSKRICGKCGNRKVADAGSYGGSSFFKCDVCGQLGMREKFPEMTVFHQITASPEVLAEKLVYKALVVGINRATYSCWRSTITEESYRTKKEAIAATVARLKEVEK